jgi:hypothetical protein
MRVIWGELLVLRGRLDLMAGDASALAQIPQHGGFSATMGLRDRTAGVKWATCGGRQRRGRIARKHDASPLRGGIDRGNRRDQSLAVGVEWLLAEDSSRRLLHHLSQVHHQNPVGEMLDTARSCEMNK